MHRVRITLPAPLTRLWVFPPDGPQLLAHETEVDLRDRIASVLLAQGYAERLSPEPELPSDSVHVALCVTTGAHTAVLLPDTGVVVRPGELVQATARETAVLLADATVKATGAPVVERR